LFINLTPLIPLSFKKERGRIYYKRGFASLYSPLGKIEGTQTINV